MNFDKRRFLVKLALFAILETPLQVLAAAGSFSITVEPSQINVKPGTEVLLQITLTNTSDREIVVTKSNGKAQAELGGYTLEVLGGPGALPSETKYRKALHGERVPEFPVIVTSRLRARLEPGQAIRDSIIVNKLYILDHPGEYRFQVERSDPVSGKVVKSNIVTVDVMQ